MDKTETSTSLPASPAQPKGLLLLAFGFGIAAGFLIAFAGTGVLAQSASLIMAVGLVALMLVMLAGVLLFLFRRRLLMRLYGIAQTQIELFADPLSRVARASLARDAEQATSAARDLVQLSLARYSWLATRRWIIASLTGLIAAMAAFAGTALLYRQNALLEQQSALLLEQNRKIGEQTTLLAQDVQLAEAARNAQLAVEITRLSEDLGKALDAARTAARSAAGMSAQGTDAPAPDAGPERAIPVLDPARDIDLGLMQRIVSASRAARPYRFLELGLSPDDDADRARVAMQRRRDDLPAAYAGMAAGFGWRDPPPHNRLTDRPASPERGQLLWALRSAGLRDFALLDFLGLDLSFAHAPGIQLELSDLTGARLAYADLSRSDLVRSRFGGAVLDNARFVAARLRGCSFASLGAAELRPPFADGRAGLPTFMNGADFSGALLADTDFRQVRGLAMNFDGALLQGVDFSGASLAASTFRGAVLAGVRFDGASLASVDLDGAIVFGADYLERLAAAAAAGSFAPGRFVLDRIGMDEVLAQNAAYLWLDRERLAALPQGDAPYRVRRIAPFETPPPGADSR